MSIEDTAQDGGNTMRNGSGSRVSRSRSNRNKTVNLPGILITALLVLVEGWFFSRLLRLKMLPAKYMVLIAVGLVLLAGAVGYLCWDIRRRTRFIIGAAIALLGSVGLIIGSGVINKVHNSIKQWEVPTTEAHQTVSMGIYVLRDDSLSALEDLSGSVIGIMETVDRDESEQVLDEISAKMKEPLQVRTYGSFTEVIQGLYNGEVRAVILDQEYIHVLSGISGYQDVTEKVRLITDYYAERPTQMPTLPGESTAVTTAEDPSAEQTDPHHGTRSWSIIKHATTESQEATEGTDETPAPTVSTTEWPEGPIGTTPPPTQPPTAWAIDVPTGQEGNIFTIYISGLDTRGGGLADRGNSDVNILAAVNMNTHQVLLLNTPRDYFVPFPTAGGARDKLTHAGYYSVQASMDCLKGLYGVTSQYYFRVGFDGLKALVNAMGGVSVYSAYEFDTGEYKRPVETQEGGDSTEVQYETAYRYHFDAGYNTVNGDEALAFARERRSLPGGDRARGGNQMALIKAVINKLASFSTIANLDAVLSAVGGLVRTTVPYDTIAAFGRSVLGGDSWNVVTYNVNGSGGMEYSFSIGTSAYVMYPDYGTVSYAQRLIRQVYNGEWVSP